MARAVGIDLGTTFSAIAVVSSSGKGEIIKNSEGENLTPSVIYFGESEIVVGKEAKQMQAVGDERVASLFKRVMGDRNWIFSIDDKNFTPTDLSALVLEKLKRDAEIVLSEPVTHAVITVPAYFSELQRRNTIEAGEKAGLKVLGILNEPTAAAIAFGAKTFDREAIYLVFDLGGGTFDVSLIKIDKDNLTVLATDGNHELGGKDWDDAIIRYATTQFKEEFGIDPLADAISLNDIFVRAEQAKKALTATSRTIFIISSGGQTGRYVITREVFEQITSHLLELATSIVEHVLAEAQLNWKDLTATLLVGGSSRMPMVHRYIIERSGKKPLEGVNVDEAVAIGASIRAHQEMYAASMGLPQSSQSIPVFALTAAKAIQDVTSHTLGMVAISKDRSRYINSRLILKNHPIPAAVVQMYQFRTSSRHANEMEVYVTQGESEKPRDCTILGKYRFLDIPHDEATGKVILEISYSYDNNMVFQVSAKERNTGTHLKYLVEPVPEDLSWLDSAPGQRAEVEQMTIYIAIDLSGSMSGEPLRKAQSAAKEFAKSLDLKLDSIGLVAVADETKVVQKATHKKDDIDRAIDSLSIGQVGGGNRSHPFSQILKLLKSEKGKKFAIVLADGVWDHQEQAISVAKECHREGIEIVAIGFGSADEMFLRAIASSDENALFTDLSNLSASFDRVAQVLGGEGLGGRYEPQKTDLYNFQ
ncbi:MAG TPA: Hsp70 family protein [bacterium]|nr:Hsp70 family protein [bacterium]